MDDYKNLVVMVCKTIQLNARIRNLRKRMAKDTTLKEGVGIYVYKTKVPDTYIHCLGELSPQLVTALNLTVYMRNLLPFKPLALVPSEKKS